MTLSIAGGEFKGAILKSPEGKTVTRPTSGKVRQALFNILREDLEGSDFLDLYAGSGAVALEALSRGCQHATLVENHRAAWNSIEENLSTLLRRGLKVESVQKIREDAHHYCQRAVAEGQQFHIAFADPPFTLDFSGIWELLLPLVKQGGKGIIQFPSKNPPQFAVKPERVYVYGESSLAVFAKTT